MCHLKLEIISFLESEEIDLPFDFRSDLWWLKMKFLSDCFEKLNILNNSLQGPNKNLVTTRGKLIIDDAKLTLSNLQKSMEKYFLKLNVEQYDWVMNPFGNYDAKDLSTSEEKQLIDLKEDLLRKTIFGQV